AAVLAGLAEAALEAWPHWYGSDLFADAPSSALDDRLHAIVATLELCRHNRHIEPAWLKKAVLLAALGKPPLATGLVGEIQIRQLALALTKRVVGITLMIPRREPEIMDGHGFPRAVEWLARESGLDVTVLLPRELADREDFAALLYGAEPYRRDAPPAPGGLPDSPSPGSSPPAADTASIPAPPGPDEDAPEHERIIGVPHPKSRGEQLLAAGLVRDPELAGLFSHNQPVTTNCGRRFIVDLLWPAGKVVVEVDGYHYHNNIIAFANDRDRDYRLLVSGYRVLRLTHDEVVRDADLAMEKIRDVVKCIHSSGSEAHNV
ncbi:MAG: endonuclease domain-containing protein, partial [Planctomycetes bacterium]|nr:endonuclease domain-containing protein [Planctomycetota bacterium]